MAKVATFSPEGPTDPAHTTILHSTEDERNVSQIGMLLQIREQASNLLIQHTEIGKDWAIDKEAQDDARTTFTLAGFALRNIIDDVQRWTLSHNEIDVKTAAVLDLKIAVHQSTLRANEKLNTPAALYRPRLRRIELTPGSPKWCCWLGEIEPRINDCHGLGDTPDEAVTAFNDAFTRATSRALSAPPPALAAPAPPSQPAISVDTKTAPKAKRHKGTKT